MEKKETKKVQDASSNQIFFNKNIDIGKFVERSLELLDLEKDAEITESVERQVRSTNYCNYFPFAQFPSFSFTPLYLPQIYP